MGMLSFGNKKLGDNIAIFSTTAGLKGSCPWDCRDCYAMKIERLRPAVALHRARNFVIAKNQQFEDLMNREINLNRCVFEFVRIHEGGEFFSWAYSNAWARIIKRHPALTFFAYTSLSWDCSILEPLKHLNNMILISSNVLPDGKRNYAKLKTLKDYGVENRICPNSLDKNVVCGKHCRYCMTKEAVETPPVFIKH